MELHGRTRSEHLLNNPTFWITAQSVYRDLQLGEELVRLIEVIPQWVPRVGLVDEGLVALCARQRLTLVSSDQREMLSRAREAGIKVLHPSELVNRFV